MMKLKKKDDFAMMKKSNQMRSFLVLALVLVSLSLVRCGSEQDASIIPAGGQISLSGQPLIPIVMPTVAVAVSGATTTVTLSSNDAGVGGQFVTRTVKLTIPANTFPVVGVPIQLSSTTTLVETTTLSSGAIVSTDFSSTKAKGVVIFSSFAPTSTIGSYQATFADNTGRTRTIVNGTFTFSS